MRTIPHCSLSHTVGGLANVGTEFGQSVGGLRWRPRGSGFLRYDPSLGGDPQPIGDLEGSEYGILRMEDLRVTFEDDVRLRCERNKPHEENGADEWMPDHHEGVFFAKKSVMLDVCPLFCFW